MTTIQYREATVADVPAMAKIRAAVWGEEEYWEKRIAGYMEGTHHPQKALKPRVLYVADDGGAVVGFIAGHLTTRYECDGELEWLNVVPEQRGKGVSAGLVRTLVMWFVSQDARRVCVNVDPKNKHARRLYERMGAKELNPHWMVWEEMGMVLH